MNRKQIIRRFLVAAVCVSALASNTAQAIILRFQEGVWNGTNSSATGYNVQDARTFGGTLGADDTVLTIRRFPAGYHMSDFRFDLTEAAAYGQPVERATLTLHVNFADTSGSFVNPGGTHYVYALPAGNTNWTEATAKADVQTTGIPWKLTGGGDTDNWGAGIFGTLIGTKTFATTPAAGEFVTYNLNPTVVNSWLANPATYPGFAILQPDSDQFYLVFYDSSETATPANRPLLEVVVPEPTTISLMALSAVVWLRRRR
jgi:hypothetical protein